MTSLPTDRPPAVDADPAVRPTATSVLQAVDLQKHFKLRGRLTRRACTPSTT